MSVFSTPKPATMDGDSSPTGRRPASTSGPRGTPEHSNRSEFPLGPKKVSRLLLHAALLLVSLLTRPAAGEALPRGDVFNPLFADPKEIRTSVDYVWTSSAQTKTALILVGVGDHLGLIRWRGAHTGETWQLGVTGGIFAQFNMHTFSDDLMNADYLVGLPLSWRLNGTSARFRIYHQSSHLGDEFLLDHKVTRVNLSYESSELVLSQEIGAWRLYTGGEWLFARYPPDLKPWVSHSGLEYRAPLGFLHLAAGRRAQWVLGVDTKTTQEHGVNTGFDFKTGVEYGPIAGSNRAGRSWSFTAEFYTGRLPFSQYFEDKITSIGLGCQLGL